MFFLLTNFIWPIKKPISISKHFNFVFDNPKTKDEIEMVKKLIKKSWDLSDTLDDFAHQRFPIEKEVPNDDVITFEIIIKKFIHYHFGKKEADKQLKKIKGDVSKIVEFYTKNWVIARYGNKELLEEDKRLRNEYKKMKKRNEKGLFLLDDDHIFIKKEKQLVDYSYLLSLLSGKGDYFGWNFLITKTFEDIKVCSSDIHIMRYIMEQWIGIESKKSDESAYRFNFGVFIESISEKVKLLDQRIKKKDVSEELILYIGDVLESSNPFNNEFSSLVRLTSIIEMLISHQPDYNRFNVEDSITKQFILKTAILIYHNDPTQEPEKVKEKLKEIYTQRSNIVHGNFNEVNKFIGKIKKEKRHFQDLISNNYDFVRIVVEEYLKDPKFVNFIKKN